MAIHMTERPLALVTGASSGIGLELAKQFAGHGYDLVMAGKEPQDLAQACAQVEALGAHCTTVPGDLSQMSAVRELYDTARAIGPVAALCANAGRGVYGDFVRDTDLEEELETIQLNVTSTVCLCKLAAPDMVARGSGHILITSSIVADTPDPFQTVYAASKSFLLSFAEGLRNAMRERGVTVTALMPGATDTAFFDTAHAQDSKIYDMPKMHPSEVARLGYDALMRGDDHIVTGSKNKMQSWLASLLPHSVVAEMARRMGEPKLHH